MTLVYFILFIGPLIFVHEFGHFLFAKLFDVKVLKFSLGFGPRAIGFRKGETEYCMSWVPLGGYVKMLGEDPTEAVAEQDIRQRRFGAFLQDRRASCSRESDWHSRSGRAPNLQRGG